MDTYEVSINTFHLRKPGKELKNCHTELSSENFSLSSQSDLYHLPVSIALRAAKPLR
jgi:hypothetical protein